MFSHRRKFRTLLWDGLRENWTGWKPGDDDEPAPTERDRAVALREQLPPWRQNAIAITLPNDVDAVLKKNYDHLLEEMTAASVVLADIEKVSGASEYAEWSDEHHRLSADVRKNGKFFTVDDGDIIHLPV